MLISLFLKETACKIIDENVVACKKTGASPALCQPSRDESREDRSAFALKKDKRNTKETKNWKKTRTTWEEIQKWLISRIVSAIPQDESKKPCSTFTQQKKHKKIYHKFGSAFQSLFQTNEFFMRVW